MVGVVNESHESMGAGEVDQEMGEGSQNDQEAEDNNWAMGEEEHIKAEAKEGRAMVDQPKRSFFPVVAAMKSARGRKPRGEGMCNIPVNSFTVLNSYDDDELELIATNCDIVLGGVGKKISGNINAIQMEEIVRAAIAEANYKHSQEVMLIAQHVLEGENLNLEIIETQQRGGS
jgi:hypothetical protein